MAIARTAEKGLAILRSTLISIQVIARLVLVID